MTVNNPHSPTTQWLDSVAADQSGYVESEPGDVGKIVLERDGKRFEVEVRHMEETNG